MAWVAPVTTLDGMSMPTPPVTALRVLVGAVAATAMPLERVAPHPAPTGVEQ
jgi:hypothetical protein